jgi:ribonuclease VapC
MVVDTSALIAILKPEPDAATFIGRILREARPAMSVANWIEAAIVIDQRGTPQSRISFDGIMDRLGIALTEVSGAHAQVARIAYQRFGRGNHDAALNYGDCFAYALARTLDQPLLFKGEDFAKTDIRSALAG